MAGTMFDTNNTLSVLNWFTSINWLNAIIALLIISVGLSISLLVRKIIYRVSVRFMPEDISSIFAKLVYYVLVAIVVITAFGTLGIDLTGFVIAGGILGIILGFALQSVTSNFISGLFLFWERPLKIGDLVDIDGIVGRVVDISIMSTKIMGLDGVPIRIPNEKVFQSVIKNPAKSVARRIDFIVGISYRSDAEKAYRVIKEVIEKHPFVLVNPPPDIFVEELGDSSVNIRVRVWAPTSEWYNVKKELLWNIKKALDKAGIEIPYPQHDLWFRSKLKVEITNKDKGKH